MLWAGTLTGKVEVVRAHSNIPVRIFAGEHLQVKLGLVGVPS
jgi:hypothetical protein